MTVKGQGPSHRQRQLLTTREQVSRAARALFADRGYVGTTIAAISEAADVPAARIYSAFGTKAKILAEILRRWIAESDVQAQQDLALANSDPAERLRMAAHWNRRQLELGFDVIGIYQDAARTDPRMADEWRNVQAGRERAIRQLVESIAADLKPDVKVATAVDLHVTCTMPEVYRSLVLERGWSPARYDRWLADLLIEQLLPVRAVASPRPPRRARVLPTTGSEKPL